MLVPIGRTINSEEEEKESRESSEDVDIEGDEVVKHGENDIVTQMTSSVSRLWYYKKVMSLFF